MNEDTRAHDEDEPLDDRASAGTTAVTDEGPAVVTVPDADGDAMPDRPDTTEDDERTSLLARENADGFRSRWQDIQARFVDRPRESVEEADRLVVEVVQQLQASFRSERDRLESQWREGSNVSTEDLRVALQRYRSFFDRLLAA